MNRLTNYKYCCESRKNISFLFFLLCHCSVFLLCHWSVFLLCHWSVFLLCHWSIFSNVSFFIIFAGKNRQYVHCTIIVIDIGGCRKISGSEAAFANDIYIHRRLSTAGSFLKTASGIFFTIKNQGRSHRVHWFIF
jgi:hypothetical protein